MLDHWIRSLSARLWVTSVAALAVCMSLLATLVIYAFSHFPERTIGRHEQIERAEDIVKGLGFDNAGRPVSVQPSDQTAWLFKVVSSELKYRVLDQQGSVLLASSDAQDRTPWIAGDPFQAAGKIEQVAIGSRSFDVVTLQVPHGHDVFYAQSAMSTRLIDAMIGAKVKQIPAIVKITILAATIIFGLTLTVTLHRALRPLREASGAAALITPHNLTARLSPKGVPSEIKPLLNAFNEALGRLENGFSVQQQFLASAAHELQTPLTLIRGQIELEPEIKHRELLFREVDLMARQVRQLLHLAEVSEPQNLSFGEVDSADVARDVVAYLSRKADREQVKIQLQVPVAAASIWADGSALFILLKNIVENAINASPPNSVVSLIVDNASIQVQDQGPGINQDHLPFLFKRYWRAPDSSHDGAGLGLAICKEIATAHEWQLTVSSLISGTRFTVWL